MPTKKHSLEMFQILQKKLHNSIVIPIKSWLGNDGSFVNSMGLTQNFEAVVDSDDLSEIEVIEEIQNKL